MLRSILAVVAGSAVWTMMWLGSNAALMGLFPQWYGDGGRVESVPVLLFVILRSVIFSVIAGYITALVARRKGIKHALALGILQLALGLIATAQFYHAAPLWYHVVFLLLLIPANVLGGQLRVIQRRRVIQGPIGFA